jgi:hypothetical protein
MAYRQTKSNFLNAAAALFFDLPEACTALPLRFGAYPSISEQNTIKKPYSSLFQF